MTTTSGGKTGSTKTAVVYFFYLVLVWSFYRKFFQFGDEFEEFLIKPIIWLLPLVIISQREKLKVKDFGLTGKNLFSSMYLTISLGIGFAATGLVVNILKHKSLHLTANIGEDPILVSILISFATAFVEEVVFRGYIFGRLKIAIKNELVANLTSSVMWMLLHLPIMIFVWNLESYAIAVMAVLTLIYGIGSAFVYARTKNI